MERTKVSSSNLKSVGYDEVEKELEVEFTSGAVYKYLDVPKNKYTNLMNAESKGKFFTRFIKNSFAFKRL